MPDLRPLRGLRYDPTSAAGLDALLCPPYDVISAAERERLAALDRHNAIHLELPAARPGDGAGSAYATAARTLASWLAEGVLRRDARPLLYLYEQRYELPGAGVQVARSFFCRLGLEEYGPTSGVRPHEATLSGPKEDRFRLLCAVRTNLSPVLLLYDDGAAGAASHRLIDELTAAPATVAGHGPGGVGQRLWAVDPERSLEAAELLTLAAARPLTIADGHHRYETALRYRDQPGAPGDARFVLALLFDARSGGLALRPWHRVIRGVPPAGVLFEAAARLFTVERVAQIDELLARLAVGQSAPGAGVIGLWTRAGGALLTVERERVRPLLPGSGSEDLRWLDVSVLSGTLSAMVGSTVEELIAGGRLAYVSDASESTALLEAGQADACFLLRPTPVEMVLAIAGQGEHMPAKSTFFHPKAATGLVFNPLSE